MKMKGKAAFINRIFPKKQAGIPGRVALAGLFSVGILLVCSKNSPLYPMNDWVDVNCFFTVGRGMVHGLTPYLDLVDQKGPLLYALFALLPGDWKGRKAFRRTAAALAAAGISLGPAAGLAWSGNVYLMGTEKESMPQYRFAETIREAGDSSLLNYGFLDGGFYFAAGSLPETRYFCTLNNDLPEMRQEMNEALAEGKTEFVVTRGQQLKGGGYTLVDRAEMAFEGRKWTYFLWRKTGNQGK